MSGYPRLSFAQDRLGRQKSILLGQNFLRSPALADSLVMQAGIGESDVVYEIGPGRGVITRALARKAGKVIGVERDSRLFEALMREFERHSNVILHLGDFRRFRIPEREFKVFANIPFNMTAEMVKGLVRRRFPPTDAYLLVQKESAGKFAGEPRSSLFSVLYGPWFSFRIMRVIGRDAFLPRPRVDAALLHIGKRLQSLLPRHLAESYRKFVKYGFSGWKPNLRSAYRNVFTHCQWKRLAKDHSFRVDATPTDLTLAQWLALFVGHDTTGRDIGLTK